MHPYTLFSNVSLWNGYAITAGVTRCKLELECCKPIRSQVLEVERGTITGTVEAMCDAVPTQPRCSTEYAKSVWTAHAEVLLIIIIILYRERAKLPGP